MFNETREAQNLSENHQNSLIRLQKVPTLYGQSLSNLRGINRIHEGNGAHSRSRRRECTIKVQSMPPFVRGETCLAHRTGEREAGRHGLSPTQRENIRYLQCPQGDDPIGTAHCSAMRLPQYASEPMTYDLGCTRTEEDRASNVGFTPNRLTWCSPSILAGRTRITYGEEGETNCGRLEDAGGRIARWARG